MILYQVVMIEIRPLPRHTDWYASDFDCYRGISVGTPRILTVIEVYRSVHPGIFEPLPPGIFGGFSTLFECIAGMPRRYAPTNTDRN